MKRIAVLTLVLCCIARAQTPAVLEVLRWNCDQPNSIGYAQIYGTLQNLSNQTLGQISVNAEFYSDKEKKLLIGQSSGYVKADTLGPNAQSTFSTSTKVSKFVACWITFEINSGIIATKYPDYSNSPPPRLP
jgi:hypothetical protein